ncbi:protein SPIRAL1-like 5 [Tripterygium wilfordii]|uniref:Protein SPIRAL1-like 5 n=1 Tax=Tripterygium wilfordii TaxID=458696 RepID=A0A7J7CJJ3_TRIWF|nr:protein SPIRAL1-like 5 [Tripterygium wilfordii]KAF5734232.1 protein SPIRAL1-like 5 [Tripterygium wilfordii]
MSRGGSFGGGQSSLGYLFGSDEEKPSPPASRPVNPPPYGVDITPTTMEKPPDSPSSEKDKASNNYHRSQGQNSGNFITDRPSTKVKSVPGGDSSLGYLFGDK